MNPIYRYWRSTIRPAITDLWWLMRMAFVIVGAFAIASWLWWEILVAISNMMGPR